MRIFIGNLPVEFSSYELRQLVCHQLVPNNTVQFLGNIFKKTHKIKRAAFEVINGEHGYYAVPFGVVFIEPDILGHKLIQSLDRYYFRETVLVAREFFVRTYSNDRRAVNWRSRTWENDERRQNDRRMGVVIPNSV